MRTLQDPVEPFQPSLPEARRNDRQGLTLTASGVAADRGPPGRAREQTDTGAIQRAKGGSSDHSWGSLTGHGWARDDQEDVAKQ